MKYVQKVYFHILLVALLEVFQFLPWHNLVVICLVDVKARLGKDDCAEGFILTKLILQKAEEDVIINVGTQLIMITEPKWKKANKLIVIDAAGSISLTGAVAEGKIDKIVINDEEESIQSDNSFTALLFIPKAGAEVRLVGYKNDKIVKKLIFKIKVGN